MKKTLYLQILYAKTLKNKDFYIRLLVFLKYIIKCSVIDNISYNVLYHTCFNIYKVNIIKDFII